MLRNRIVIEQMPADFLTKWIPLPKFRASITYATNSTNAVLPNNQPSPGTSVGGSVGNRALARRHRERVALMTV